MDESAPSMPVSHVQDEATSAPLDQRLTDLAVELEQLNERRDKLVVKRSRLQSRREKVQAQRSRVRHAEVVFMNSLRNFYNELNSQVPPALKSAFASLQAEDDALGAIASDYEQTETDLRHKEWSFWSEEEDFYQNLQPLSRSAYDEPADSGTVEAPTLKPEPRGHIARGAQVPKRGITPSSADQEVRPSAGCTDAHS
ncbi:hypothetical protein M011DRAFT_472757 [Sporormia fimetaria CBS 119925]|uniref:Uncharacterized protein n=1 Tax=Sporormia fimetaria CBS 119925 TaxID=1340428 RepID=A0A6A6UXJ7_9PLEO|nr:hypothetical protein M011DRAFT_472757 [Sporormia fimetaria CBS 119925]